MTMYDDEATKLTPEEIEALEEYNGIVEDMNDVEVVWVSGEDKAFWEKYS